MVSLEALLFFLSKKSIIIMKNDLINFHIVFTDTDTEILLLPISFYSWTKKRLQGWNYVQYKGNGWDSY